MRTRAAAFFLLAAVAASAKPPRYGAEKLWNAALKDDFTKVEELIAQGVLISPPDGQTPIEQFAMFGPKSGARGLLDICLRDFQPGVNCSDAIHGAAALGDVGAIESLLSKGATINDEVNKMTPLIYALWKGQREAAKLLLDKGADADAAEAKLEGAIAGMSGHANEGVLAQSVAFNKAGLSLLRSLRPKAASSAGEGVSREELAKIVQAAVAGAKPAEPAVAPAPAGAKSDVDKPKYKAAPRPDDFAIVVGIEKYTEVPAAPHAERDAQAVRDHLVAMGYPERNVILLKGERATRTGLVKNIETWLPRNVSDKSNVFFYYSGHGAPDPKSGQAYLVPQDGDPQYLEDSGYPVKRLYEKLEQLKAKQVIVALDSCFSGAGGRSVLAKGTRPLVGKVDIGASGGKIVSLAASQGDQISGTADEQGHGLFTYFLLRGLNGAAANDSGAVTVKSLYDYLLPNVQDRARRDNRDQSPRLIGSGDVRLR